MSARLEHPSPMRLVALGALLSAFAAGAAAQEAIRTEIFLEPDDVVGLDEVVILEIKVSVEGNWVPSIPDPVFRLDNLRQLEGPSQSTGLTTVNGRRQASRTLTWRLAPRRLGTARVHSASVTIEGQTFDIEDREVEVVRHPPAGRESRRAATDPFDRLPFDDPQESWRRPRRRSAPQAPRILLRAEVSPGSPWVGQQAIYTLNLYTQVDIKSVNPEEFPDFKGFWARVIPQPEQRPQMVHYEGESFGRVVLIQRALFPRRAGTFEIAPIAARMFARIPETSPYGSPLPKSREIVRQSNPVRIRVRELPPPPPGFQGAVGSIELAAELSPWELEVGEAATLALELSGRAHLQGVQAPQLPEIPGIRVFPPQQKGEEVLRGDDVHSTRTWSFVLVPQRPGQWELPAIEIPFFDPRRERYEVAASQPLVLRVKASARGVPARGGEAELHAIRTAALPAVGRRRDLTGLLPWLFGVPWVIAAGVVLVRRRHERDGRRPTRRRLLARLDEAAAEERPRQAAAELEEAWREFLAERFRIAPSSPTARWGPSLVERGVAADRAEALVRLADDLHYLRYAPKLSSVGELREELLERSRKLARSLG